MTVGTSNFPFGKVTFRMGYLKLPGCIQSENESDVLYKIQLVACYPNSTNKKQKKHKNKTSKTQILRKKQTKKNSPYNQPASKTSSNLHLFPTNLGIRIGGGSMLLTQSLGDEIPGIPSATRERSNQRLVDESRMKLSCCYCSFFGDVWNLPLTICIQYI